jgi:hypothetical protein
LNHGSERKLNSKLLVLKLLILTSTVVAAAPTSEKIFFEVKDLESGENLFHGQETESVDGDIVRRTSEYFTPANQKVQVEQIVFSSTTLLTTNYLQENLVTGEHAKLSTAGETSSIQYRSTASSESKTADVKNTKALYLGKVLQYLILNQWDRLVAGGPVVFDLIVPFKLDTYRFHIFHVGKSGTQHVFRLEPESWFLRRLVDTIDFHFESTPTHRLVRYVGPTAVNTDGNRDRKVVVDFRYEPSK